MQRERQTDRQNGSLITPCVKAYGKLPLEIFILNATNESFKIQDSQCESILGDHWKNYSHIE